jgi:hypothetical protein
MVVMALWLSASASSAPARVEQAASPQVNAYLAYTNNLRASQGLAPLQLDSELTALAQSWAEHIAVIGELVHPEDVREGLDESRWLKLGDNVAKGSTIELAWAGLLESPVHYTNLTDPDFTHIGIGVGYAPDGTQFVNQRFMQATPVEAEPTPTEPPTTVAAPTESTMPPPTVLAATFAREVNVAVIPPIRYGRPAVPGETPIEDDDVPTWVFVGVGALVTAVALLATWQVVRGRRGSTST